MRRYGCDQRKQPTGTVYRSSARLRLPRDRQLRIGLAIGTAGVALGALLATGLLHAGGAAVRARWMPAPGAGFAGPGGTAAGAGLSPPAGATPTAQTIPVDASPGAAPPDPAMTASASAGTAGPGAEPTPVGPSAPVGGVRRFRSVAAPDCLGTPAGEITSAYPVTCAGSGQRWLAAPAHRDVIALVSLESGRCLAVEHPDLGTGTPLRQQPCDGNAHQHWQLIPATGGAVALLNVRTGRCAALPDPTTTGAPVRQLACRGTPDQLWLDQPS